MMMLLPYFSFSHRQLPYHHPHDNKLFLCNVQKERKEPLFAVNPSTQQLSRFTTLAADKSGGFPSSLNPFSGSNKCETCKSQGSIECPGCKGTGRNKKNGNIFERWKCFECQGFGLKSCPQCGKGGLTPEQRGER